MLSYNYCKPSFLNLSLLYLFDYENYYKKINFLYRLKLRYKISKFFRFDRLLLKDIKESLVNYSFLKHDFIIVI